MPVVTIATSDDSSSVRVKKDAFDPSASATSSSKLGYRVEEIVVGVLAPPDASNYAEGVAKDLRRMAPDRVRARVFCDAEKHESWPRVDVLIVCLSKSNFASLDVQRYVAEKEPKLVLTDLDLKRTLSDRRIFYDILEAGGLTSRVPLRAYASRDGYPNDTNPKAVDIVERRDQIEVNGKILLKPVMERPVDPEDLEVRIYYPRSIGGGCKILTFDVLDSDDTGEQLKGRASFEPELNTVCKDEDRSFVYEELMVDRKSRDAVRSNRKRDRLKSLALNVLPGMEQHLTKQTADTPFGDDDEVTYESDLSRTERTIYIVTTAALPWMTGTAVNPLLRAAYLTRGRPEKAVTLVIPWLELEEDRKKVYGKTEFKDMAEQEVFVRNWLKDRADMVTEADPEKGLQILFYPARYHADLGSIFAMGDICALIPNDKADFAILEEPEHLNWFRASGEAWTAKFTHVVGIIHTNYKAYAATSPAGVVAAQVIGGMSTLMVRAYCDKVIKLSAVLQTFAPEKEVVCNVHGVREEFIREGKRRSDEFMKSQGKEKKESEKTCVYFIGKILWEKGLDRMLRLEDFYKEVTGEYFAIDIYGDGPDLEEIKQAYHDRSSGTARLLKKLQFSESAFSSSATSEDSELATKKLKSDDSFFSFSLPEWSKDPVPAEFHGRIDHALLTEQYKIFINPSITEVLCTTVYEALAMGKFVIIPVHPSNEFFMQFPNCLAYNNKLEFAENLVWALTHDPEPLSEEMSYVFTWKAATERLIRASGITMKEARQIAKAKKTKLDDRIAYFYNKVGEGSRGDVIRRVLGGGPVAGQTKYQKSKSESLIESDDDLSLEDRGLFYSSKEKKRSRPVLELLPKVLLVGSLVSALVIGLNLTGIWKGVAKHINTEL